ncbi:MupG family TIM beta-alpha barrel fold protein [Enterococcus diestrammenae]|uniref:MupG family TIM beta-alpha barrel fold protein n=1 Tax=Enterococcus diestrammenae TaxID=1155073 RepID=UPI00195D7566
MLGVSVYLKDLDVSYLEQAAKIGAKYVFTSLHIPEEDFSDIDVKLPLLLETCRNNDLLLVPDVSPVTFEKLQIPAGDMEALKALGVKAVRLDYGFDDIHQLVTLQKDFILFLNASVVSLTFLQQAEAAGLDLNEIQMAHNFYPKTDTGLSASAFEADNRKLVERGLKIMAFVPGDALKRFPLYQGLPTLEKHRGVHPFVAAVELIKDFGVTDILIGDSLARFATLEMIQRYLQERVLTLPVALYGGHQDFYGQELAVRRDIPEKVVRLATPRIPKIAIEKTLQRKKGMITMENELGGRYSGEINLCREDLPFSAATNCIGFVHPEFVDLLQWVDRDTKIRFEPIDFV